MLKEYKILEQNDKNLQIKKIQMNKYNNSWALVSWKKNMKLIDVYYVTEWRNIMD